MSFNRFREQTGAFISRNQKAVLFLLTVAAAYGFFPYGLETVPWAVTAVRVCVLLLFLTALISPLKKPDTDSSGTKTPPPETDETKAAPPPGPFVQNGNDIEIIRELSDQFYVKSRKDTEKDFTLFLEKILTIVKKTFAAQSSALFLVNPHNNTVTLKSIVSDRATVSLNETFPPDSGIIGEVLNGNSAYFKEHIGNAAETLHYYREPDAAVTALAAPVFVDKEAIGILTVDSAEENAFTEDDIHLVETYGGVVAEVIVNYNNLFEFENSARIFSSFYEVSRGLNSNLKFDEVLDLLISILEQIFKFDRITISQYESGGDQAEVIRVRGQMDDFPEGFRFQLVEGLNGWVIRKQKPLRVADMEKGDLFMPRYSKEEKTNYELRSFLAAPISYHDFCFGAVSIENRKPNAYKERHERILVMLANNFGVALERSYVLEQLESLATTDGLTKLYNYRSFVQRLNEETERSLRYKMKFSLLMLDIDFFKKVNDTYGHLAGDQVLKNVAEIIKASTRGIDFCARYGGEEFAVILIEAALDDALISAERIRRNIQNMVVPFNNQQIGVTISIGAVEFSEEEHDQQTLIDHADKALYKAKEGGRNRIMTYIKES